MTVNNRLLPGAQTEQSVRRTVATNVKYLMATRGWSQVQLAKRSGIAQMSVSNILNARGPAPTLRTLSAISAALDTSPALLLIPGMTPPDRPLAAAP